tara:strand:+ start:370 stop:603 length:234 start_codon:yes stop_codon:yes gene_type:complete
MSSEDVHPCVVVPYCEGDIPEVEFPDGTKVRAAIRECATEWRVVRPDDDPTTDNEVLFKFETEAEAVKKCNEINNGE